MSKVAWMSRAALFATFCLFAVGAMVRGPESGLPPFQFEAWVEYGQRLAAGLTAIFIVATALFALLSRRRDPWIFWAAGGALFLLVVQVVLAGLTILLGLPPTTMALYFASALTIFAALVVVASASGQGVRRAQGIGRGLGRMILASTVAVYLLLVSGAYVVGSNASLACASFPFCPGSELIPTRGLAVVNYSHRIVASLVGLLVIATAVWAWRERAGAPRIARMAIAAAVLFLAQGAIGALIVFLTAPPLLTGAHLAAATAILGLMVAMSVYVLRRPQPAEALDHTPAGEPTQVVGLAKIRHTVGLYLNLTKWRIIVLLLVTTLCAALIAARGLPDLGLLLVTLLGGALAAASANAINSYMDRDIDALMARTRQRVLVKGGIDPGQALDFGVVTGVVSFLILALWANLLAAVLSLFGLLFYVIVYTGWLKRSTPQNIVIGGAAGAIPPLVGWAAVTGGIGLVPIYMFLIIFLWTPPHFWALALMLKGDYARAGVPMLPVVAGEPETFRQIWLYSLILLGVTLLPPVTGSLGWVYTAVAGLLGLGMLYYAWLLRRDGTKQRARKLFLYSNGYLALLFAAMVADRIIPVGLG